jgi:hypothetical protein
MIDQYSATLGIPNEWTIPSTRDPLVCNFTSADDDVFRLVCEKINDSSGMLACNN